MRAWNRIKPTVRNMAIVVMVMLVVSIGYAWLAGIDLDGSGRKVTLGPADAVRNFGKVFPAFLRAVGPLTLLIVFYLFIGIIQFVGIFWYMSRGRTYTLFPGELTETFDDFRGQPQIVDSTKQVMDLFQAYKEFGKIGGYPPHGILFEGPPGTGKTLMAKAIAGESNVPFMYASGAGFINMFLGVSNLRVGRMFTKARKYSERWGGCVMFMDELDSIGGARVGVSNARMAEPDRRSFVNRVFVPGMGSDSSLVNELLTQMDGIGKPRRFRRWIRRTCKLPPAGAKHYNILIIGATNRANTLDPALTRPGRFDRKIHVGKPSEDGRKDVIAYYLKKVSHAPIDIDRMAGATSGYSPAEIKNIINEALIYALQDDRDALTYDDVWKAKLTHEIGLVEPVTYSDWEKVNTAIHEGGHALAAALLKPEEPVQIVTIRKRGGTLGLVWRQEAEETHSSSKSDVIADIKISLAGMVSEEMFFGESTTGPSGDLMAATMRAVHMVTRWGMGSRLLSHAVVQDTDLALKAPEVRAEVDALLHQYKEETRDLLEQHRPVMERLRDLLVEKGEITGDEFAQLLFEMGVTKDPPKVAPTFQMVPAFAGWGGNGHGGGHPMPGAGWPAPTPVPPGAYPGGYPAPGYAPPGYPTAPPGYPQAPPVGQPPVPSLVDGS